MAELRVVKTYDSPNLEHWVVASDKQRPVTVRRGKGPKFCCLTCSLNACRHIEAVEDYEVQHSPSAAEDAA